MTPPPALPKILANPPSPVIDELEGTSGKKEEDEEPNPAATLSAGPGQPNSDEVIKTTLAEDSWVPHPLVASRDPIDEEGTFIAFCPHLIHARCKEKARTNSKSGATFECPVCHALSNFDLTLYGHVTDGLSPVWLSRQLGFKDVPAALKELFNLIDLVKSTKNELLWINSGAGEPETLSAERLSQLQTCLSEVFPTCQQARISREMQIALPVWLKPTQRSNHITSSLRYLVHGLAVQTDPDRLLNHTLNNLYRSIHNCFDRLCVFAEFAGLDVDDFLTNNRTGENIKARRNVNSLAQVGALHQSARELMTFVEHTRHLGVRAIWLAACEWRGLRHAVAYTLVVWERYLRHQSPNVTFFNGGLSESHRTNLCYLLRAAFQAHARLAPVPRGCPLACQNSDSDAGQRAHAECWPQRRDDPDWWWWHSYFSPAMPDATHTGEAIILAANPGDLFEPVSRVAVSEDAVRLWSLLLPDHPAQRASTTSETAEHAESTMEWADYSLSADPSSSTPSMKVDVGTRSEGDPANPYQSVSALWEIESEFLVSRWPIAITVAAALSTDRAVCDADYFRAVKPCKPL
ncbi:unnamed protein product [Dibothriocephalus latus]|uniref:Uncharacterized protein n=1 Tax=Dibothriocephalus latus TaxID=60516 RepID=A0A3P7PBL3_DIBLA|nr:unnamed protein product [Dibothriocephalus latus]